MEIRFDKEKRVLISTFHHLSGNAVEFGRGATTGYSPQGTGLLVLTSTTRLIVP